MMDALRLAAPDDPRGFPSGIDWDRMCYWQGANGTWYLSLPGGGLGNLSEHDVVEHEDGTITVSPSILVTGPSLARRHGFLRRGRWEPCGDDQPPEGR